MLFLALVVPVSALSLWLTLRAGQQVSERLAQESIERAQSQTQQAAQMLLGPITAMLGQLAHIAAKDPEAMRGARGLGVLLNSLSFQDDLAHVYIGDAAQGSFYMALKVTPPLVLGGQGVPEGTNRATRQIERAGPDAADRYVFMSDTGEVIGRREVGTDYDPRSRPWYRQALAEGQTSVSDPYVFATTGLRGVTVSTPVMQGNTMVAAIGANLTLEGLNAFLARHRASPNATTLLLDRNGQVVAYSGFANGSTQQAGNPPSPASSPASSRSLDALPDKGPATAWLMRTRLGMESFSYEDPQDGRRMMASFLPVTVGQGVAWQVMILAPRTDFSRDLDAAGQQVLGFLVGALLLQIVLIYSLLPWITRPLENLAQRVQRLRQLEFDASAPPIHSRVREIAALSQTVQTLGLTVNTFASFVPRDLVRQLIDSGQGLTAGGRSRFLTILFTDLEGFSSLAERHPAQALLSQVSEYFGIATRCIGQEHGTVDKFIGDAVMAFWGAPQLLEDHAWRACVAALRIQRRLALRNAQWVQEGLEPLGVRIGIHCDAVLVGNIGSAERMSYTVMGDGVNVASRLEGLNKDYGTRLCVSQTVFREAGERLWLRPLDIVAVKGRRTELEVYELMGARGADEEVDAALELQRLCTQSLAAFDHLRAGRWAEATAGYSAICQAWPEDRVSRRLLERCQQRAGSAP